MLADIEFRRGMPINRVAGSPLGVPAWLLCPGLIGARLGDWKQNDCLQ